MTNDKFGTVASDEQISKTVKALGEHNIATEVVDSLDEARSKVLSMVPEGSEVFTMTSVTLDDTGIAKEINESGKYDSIRNKLNSMDRATQGKEMNKLGAAPDYTIGSVHAVTEDGKLVIASKTGSQLPAYASAAAHVIWVVGAQKLVSNLDAAFTRIYEYTLPLEEERAQKAYGMGSAVNKLLIVNNEIMPDRIKMVIIKEKVGF